MRASAFALVLAGFAVERVAVAQTANMIRIDAAESSPPTTSPSPTLHSHRRRHRRRARLTRGWYAPRLPDDRVYRRPRHVFDGQRAARMAGGGAALFWFPYTAMVVFGAVSFQQRPTGVAATRAGLAFLPVFGPLVNIALLDPSLGWGSFMAGFGFLVDGLAQAAGVALFVAGRVGMARAARQEQRNSAAWMITPGASGADVGATVTVVAF